MSFLDSSLNTRRYPSRLPMRDSRSAPALSPLESTVFRQRTRRSGGQSSYPLREKRSSKATAFLLLRRRPLIHTRVRDIVNGLVSNVEIGER
jgi:hypothetical protein